MAAAGVAMVAEWLGVLGRELVGVREDVRRDATFWQAAETQEVHAEYTYGHCKNTHG